MICLTASARIIREVDCSASIERDLSTSARIERDVTTDAVIVRDVTCTAVIQRDFKCRIAFVCSVDLNIDSLWASDQLLLTIDGGRIYVTKATS